MASRVRITEDVRKLSGKVHIAASGYKVQVVQPGTTTPVTVYQAATGGATHSWFGTDSTGMIVPFNADPATTGTAVAGGEMWADKQAVELRVLTLANVEVTRERVELVSAADALSVESGIAVVKESPPNPKMPEYGAVGDGSTDDTAALTAFLAAGKTSGYIPPGTYNVASQLAHSATMSLRLDPAAKLRATSSMASILTTPLGTLAQQQTIQGGILDCNELATSGLLLPYFAHYTINDVRVLDSAGDAVILGDTGAANSSFEAMVSKLVVSRTQAHSVPASSRGLYMRNVTDSEVSQAIIVGCDVGVRNDGASNKFSHVHAWGYSGKNPSVCFDDNAGANYFNCYADTPTTYGFRLRQGNSSIMGGGVFNGQFGGVDNVVVGVKVDAASPIFAMIGMTIAGQSSSYRIAKAYEYTNGIPIIFGNRYSNVTTTTNDTVGVKGNSIGLVAFNSSNAAFFSTNGGGKLVEFPNAAALVGYSGNYATQTWKIDATGKGMFAAGLGVGNSAAATESIGKAVTKKIEVFDASGTSLGFIPVYASIT